MQYHNIESLTQNPEEVKDTAFSVMVGWKRPLDEMTDVESFESCQAYRRMYSQPAIFGISNDRGFTDRVLMPTHYDFDSAQKYVVDELSQKHQPVEVTDKEIEELRVRTRNKISQGDAIELILKSKFKEYKGLVEDGQSTGVNIVDAVYDPVRHSTFYYL